MLKVDVRVNDRTKELLAELQRQQLAFVTLGGQAIRTQAISRTPVMTGNLRSSIQTEAFVEDGRSVSETGPTADYAKFVEYGTRFQKAHPFMEPGYQAAKPNIDRIFERLLK